MRAQLVQQTSLESLFYVRWTVLELGNVCCLLLGITFASRGGFHIHLLQLWETLGAEESFLPGFSSSPPAPIPMLAIPVLPSVPLSSSPQSWNPLSYNGV